MSDSHGIRAGVALYSDSIMITLQAIYIALAVFGVGVTVVDLFGALDHAGQDDSGHGDHDGHGGHDAIGHDAAHDVGGHEAIGHEAAGHEAGQGGHDAQGGHEAHGHGGRGEEGSVLGLARAEQAGLRKSSSVARFIGALRMGVYFSLGAGPTGLVALATKIPPAISVLWAAATGVAIAVLARVLRKFLRRDLDSSFKAEDFLLEEATITVPVAPGLVGRAMVRKFGAQAEVYVRATSGDTAYERGARVRIIDYQDDVYIVENADEEHLVR